MKLYQVYWVQMHSLTSLSFCDDTAKPDRPIESTFIWYKFHRELQHFASLCSIYLAKLSLRMEQCTEKHWGIEANLTKLNQTRIFNTHIFQRILNKLSFHYKYKISSISISLYTIKLHNNLKKASFPMSSNRVMS